MVTIEYIMGLVRGGKNHNVEGDPYDFCCTVIIDGNTAEIRGMAGTVTKDNLTEVVYRLNSIGVTKIIYDRIKNGIKTKKEYMI